MNVSQIELSLTPALYEWRTIKKHHTTVAVDILRATTAICAAFEAGAEEIVPLESLDELADYGQRGYLCAAERGGMKVEGATYGNSPTEYLASDLHGKRLAYSTTNGTVSIRRGSDAERTLVGCFSNISALASELIARPQDLVILCSGWRNDFSVEDTLFAGALCRRLLASGLYGSHNDAVAMALTLWDSCGGDPYSYSLQHASHVQRLIGFNALSDIVHAFKEDTCRVVPRLADNKLICNNLISRD